MRKQEEASGIVTHVDYPNKGIVCAAEKTVIVKNTIEGQKVRFRINKKKAGKLEGRLLFVEEQSPLETKEKMCHCFPDCGGCLYQTVPYETQLSIKEKQIRDMLDAALLQCGQADAAGHPDYLFEGILPSPAVTGYRNKMEYSFGDEVQDGPLTLGLHKRGTTYDVLTADDCILVHPDFNAIVSETLSYCRQKMLSHYHKMRHTGYLRHLLVRRSVTTGEILVAIVTSSQIQHDFEPLCARLRALQLEGRITGILHVTNDNIADVVKPEAVEVLYGQDFFYERIMGLQFKVSIFSFFQTNSLGAEVLYEAARRYIGDTKDMTVFDLYSGTGTIAQILAPVAKEVIGVEIVEEAVVAARENAERNNIANCRFIANDVLTALDEIEEQPDFIVLDPPRDGINPRALTKIIQYGVKHMVYISCKPTSLMRDLQMLTAGGYRVDKAVCVDMFCMTPHVETVVLLSRKNSKYKEVEDKIF